MKEKKNSKVKTEIRKHFSPLFIMLLFFAWVFTPTASYGLKNLTVEERQALYNLREERWEANSRNILKRISGFRGEAGITVKDLKTGWTFLHNEDQPFPAASLVKIPIMVACFKAAQDGLIDLGAHYVLQRKDKVGGSGVLRRMRSGRIFTWGELIDYMVTESDNTAANILIDKLGFDYINRIFRKIGLEKTTLNRRMIDFSARDQGLENYTTAAEMTELLEKIYYGQCFNREISERCLEILKRQKINDRLPRYLPKGVVVAHKTGLEREVCHDAGIVFSPYGDYIITVLVHTWTGPDTAKKFIARLSSYFYQVFKT